MSNNEFTTATMQKLMQHSNAIYQHSVSHNGFSRKFPRTPVPTVGRELRLRAAN